jgi:hypothetical protein
MGQPTFDDWNSEALPRIPSREASDFQSSQEGMEPLNKIGGFKLTRGTETSQYPEERTSTETPLVVASERGPGQ